MTVIYLDHNATTPCAPEVVEAMASSNARTFANPASSHSLGRAASDAVARARADIAECLGCDLSEIFFTSGATESNNHVFFGLSQHVADRTEFVASAIEHKSVLAPLQRCSALGFTARLLPVEPDGTVTGETAIAFIGRNTLLVSLQGANNEVGSIQPVRAIADLAHRSGALMHCDATQLLGRIPVDLHELSVDFASFSAHKVYGPKGIGLLYVRQGQPRAMLAPILLGGDQEACLRAGTLNVPGIIGFAEACRLVTRKLQEDAAHLTHLQTILEIQLLEGIPGASVNASGGPRIPGTTSVTLPFTRADTLIANLPHVCISGGSACSSGTIAPSHVLVAMGRTPDESERTVRLGVGRYTSEAEVRAAASMLIATIARLGDHAD